MSSVFLSPEVFIELFLELIQLLILSYAFFQTLYILKYYKDSATTQLQYRLEKKSYLVSVVVSVVLMLKIVLVAFFTYSLDELSSIVFGAMCGAGVLSSNDYGISLFLLKLVVLLFSFLWILLNKADNYTKNNFYFKKKMWLFLFIYILIVGEYILSIKFFSSIPTQDLVTCCSTIYKNTTNPIPFNLSKYELLVLFCSLYLIVIVSAYKKSKIFLSISGAFFIYLAYYVLVYFFSAYIYELPTHQCPFCMLQKEYNYIGYLIYITLFLGIYNLIAVWFVFVKNSFYKVILFFTLFIFILCEFFFKYFLVNSTLL